MEYTCPADSVPTGGKQFANEAPQCPHTTTIFVDTGGGGFCGVALDDLSMRSEAEVWYSTATLLRISLGRLSITRGGIFAKSTGGSVSEVAESEYAIKMSSSTGAGGKEDLSGGLSLFRFSLVGALPKSEARKVPIHAVGLEYKHSTQHDDSN